MKEKKKQICVKCNEEKEIENFYYSRTRKTRCSSCKSCNTKDCLNYQQKSGYRNSEKYVFYQRAYNIKRDKGRGNIEIMEDLQNHLSDLWLKQDKKCHYTGLEMNINGYKNNNLAMTVDRVIPEKGYVEGNIVLCCNIVNKMKQNLTIEELKFWCKTILENI